MTSVEGLLPALPSHVRQATRICPVSLAGGTDARAAFASRRSADARVVLCFDLELRLSF